ncbi:MAG: hypothetical protein KBT04_04480 [Bacteroidales bacterium]|nr:hypothetical protein [Candidatus Colimorpha onthohippi]
MKKTVLRLVCDVVIVAALLLVCDVACGVVASRWLRYFHNRDSVSCIERASYVLGYCDEEIILIGSSRCAHGLESQVLEDSLRTHHLDYKVYNAGYHNRGAVESACFLDAILDRYTPKAIVMEYYDYMFQCGDDSLLAANFVKFAPIGKHNRYLRKGMNQVSHYGVGSLVKIHSGVYRIKQTLVEGMGSVDIRGGYEPIGGVMPSDVLAPDGFSLHGKPLQPIQREVDAMRHIIQRCKAKGVLLIFVIAPYFQPDACQSFLPSLACSEGVMCVDYYNTDFFNAHPELFRDRSHVNHNGAHRFTSQLFTSIWPSIAKVANGE